MGYLIGLFFRSLRRAAQKEEAVERASELIFRLSLVMRILVGLVTVPLGAFVIATWVGWESGQDPFLAAARATGPSGVYFCFLASGNHSRRSRDSPSLLVESQQTYAMGRGVTNLVRPRERTHDSLWRSLARYLLFALSCRPAAIRARGSTSRPDQKH